LAKILIIDDYPESIALIKSFFLTEPHTFINAGTGEEGVRMAREEKPDLILLDIQMPGMNGFDVCTTLRKDSATKHIPVIMITGLDDNRARARSYELNADYLTKPFNIYDIKMRVRNALELESFKKQLRSAEDLIFKLAMIAEVKDAYAQGSSLKLATQARHFARELGLDQQDVMDVARGGLLHAVGKIEIDEKILAKPGPLTPDEFDKIRTYPVAGERIVEPIHSLHGAVPIVRSHKEMYDGSGYPDQLKGEDIPFLARIISLSGSFNALTTNRPYRKALKKDDALDVMEQETRNGKFDPDLFKEFKKIYKKNDPADIPPLNMDAFH